MVKQELYRRREVLQYSLFFSFVEILELDDVWVTGTSVQYLHFLVNSGSGISVVPCVLLDHLKLHYDLHSFEVAHCVVQCRQHQSETPKRWPQVSNASYLQRMYNAIPHTG